MPSALQEPPAARGNAAECELTILMPCLNEAETIERCIAKAQRSRLVAPYREIDARARAGRPS